MTDYAAQFFMQASAHLQTVIQESSEQIHAAAKTVADAIANDKDFLTFGSGHSELVAREVFYRAGGLASALHIQDHTGGDAERIEGVAALILGHYALRAGSVIIIISNSGINPVPVEAAMVSKSAGLTVVAITALAHSQSVPARHSSGKKLYDIADITIDTHIPRGDTAIEVASGLYVGSLSTLTGITIVQAITVQAAGVLAERGITPPVLLSSNVPEGDVHNHKLKQRYMPRLVRFPVDTADLTPNSETLHQGAGDT